jgi:predicted  nucleic acid-binding Zn-ribbon protein
MAEPSDLAVMTFELLKRIQVQLDDMQADIRDLKVRMSAVEGMLAQQGVQIAALNSRMDRFDERLIRIERRLDLVEDTKPAAE